MDTLEQQSNNLLIVEIPSDNKLLKGSRCKNLMTNFNFNNFTKDQIFFFFFYLLSVQFQRNISSYLNHIRISYIVVISLSIVSSFSFVRFYMGTRNGLVTSK